MIGIIGPADSVDLAVEVAAAEGRSAEVTTKVYSEPEQAPQLARELDEVCPFILFTGRIPYTLVTAEEDLRAETDFMRHSGVDLYRALAKMLIAHQGRLPRVSVDTIEADTVRDTYRDIDVTPPTEILPIADGAGALLAGREEITRYHQERYRSGAVEACLTCLGSVHRDLSAAGVPVWRVEHTHASVRDALRRAWLQAAVHQSRATQTAVMLVRLDEPAARPGDPYVAERERLRLHEKLLEHAERMRGRLTIVDTTTFLITTTRGTVERAIERDRAQHASLLTLRGVEAPHTVGFGVGTTVAAAEDNARKALDLSEQRGQTQVVLPDGEIYASVAGGGVPVRLREVAPGMLRVSRQLGLGTLSTRRLLDALHRIGGKDVTARQLADVYGVESRSARRLLNALRAAGYAEEAGVHVNTGAGRPQTVYRVDLQRLVAALGEESGG